jgi:uncharacterized membrane protein
MATYSEKLNVLKDKLYNSKFITLFVIIFMVLFVFCSFVNFIGHLPVLIVVTLLISYYFYDKYYEKVDISNLMEFSS